MSDLRPEHVRAALDHVPAIPYRFFEGLNQDHQLHILRMVAARMGLNRADQVIRQLLEENCYYRSPSGAYRSGEEARKG